PMAPVRHRRAGLGRARPRMLLALRTPALLATLLRALLGTLAGPAVAKPKPAAPKVLEVPDGEALRLHLEGDPAAQGWLYRPPGLEEPAATEPVALLVALHGAGGTPKTFFMPQLTRARRAYVLAVAGHEAVSHAQGDGFMWSGSDVDTILALLQHVLDTRPVDRARVIVWGHSAGGSMTLETLARAPALFAGALTTAAPRTPDTRHQDERGLVLRGPADPNWAVVPAVRTHMEGLAKKKGKGACALLAVEGLGHNVPDEAYLDLGFDWVLAAGTRGSEARVPQRPAGRQGAFRVVQVPPKGAPGAAEDAPSRKAAADLLKRLRKELEAGRAFFPLEAAVHSRHASAPAGGGVDEATLRALAGAQAEALLALAPGALGEVLDLEAGLLLVRREP
ncbi:MAG: prolyl oligopeptidase family serine peptidase, partial [Planctomycetia bacterium]